MFVSLFAPILILEKLFGLEDTPTPGEISSRTVFLTCLKLKRILYKLHDQVFFIIFPTSFGPILSRSLLAVYLLVLFILMFIFNNVSPRRM